MDGQLSTAGQLCQLITQTLTVVVVNCVDVICTLSALAADRLTVSSLQVQLVSTRQLMQLS